MVRNLMHDPLFLKIPSAEATANDVDVANDLRDTLLMHRATCVGMAANMIGVSKRIIAFTENGRVTVMYNPEIISKSKPYPAEEGCLSLLGEPRPTVRFQTIRVAYRDEHFHAQTKTFKDFTAQIIQHEIDHCNGILI